MIRGWFRVNFMTIEIIGLRQKKFKYLYCIDRYTCWIWIREKMQVLKNALFFRNVVKFMR